MIYCRLPTTTFAHTDAAVCVGTALGADRCGKSFEAVFLMNAIIVHTFLSSLLGFAPEWIQTAASRHIMCPQKPFMQAASYDEAALSKTKCSHQCKHPARAAHPLLPVHGLCCLSFTLRSTTFASYTAWLELSNPLSLSLPVFLTPHKPPAAWCNACLCMCTRAVVCFFYLAQKV